MWSRTRSLNSSAIYPSIRKYWVNKESNSSNAEGIIPLLRLSEMYLIAVETASLSEAGTLYQEYMLSKNVSWNAGFASEENRHSELMREYRREYFAEGQMFYFYKRHQTTSLWSQTGQVTETDYILPLPNTEFNPDNN